MATVIWSERDGSLATQVLDAPRWLAAGGRLFDEPGFATLLMVPVRRYAGAVAALLVPDDLRGRVVHNGMTADGGLLPLRHADHVQIDDWSIWTAGEFMPEETAYSPTTHDQEARCFISKARLRDGEPITICPGQSGKPCGMVYKRAAWTTVVAAAAKFRCPNCGYDPKASVWRPTLAVPHPTLDHVFELLSLESSR